MRQFVTGGAGFIGSHLADRLGAEGEQVTVYDNLISGRKPWVQHHIGKDGFQFIQGDLLDFETLKQSMKGHEVVWHLGANTDILKGNRITDLDLKNCTIATWNVLEAMRQLGIDKITFASSATVYGDTPPAPISETFGPTQPISLYGAGKLACEALISAYCHLFNLKGWIFRFGNVVGDGMSHGVIFDFIQKLRRNPRELEVLGDGEQAKNYFMVEDCIDGMMCVVRNSSKQCDLFNLGCDTTIKVKDIASIVIEEMGLIGAQIRFTGGNRGWPGDVPKVDFNLEKVRTLGWVSRHTSTEAVRIATRRLLGKGE